MTRQASTPAPTTDGRAARGQRTRTAIADAMLALFEEGDLRPTAPRVAERAGVSLRSVFQHFEDMESMYAAVADRQLERVLSKGRPVPREGPLEARIRTLSAERARIHELITPARRAALLMEPFSAEIAARLRWVRNRGRSEVAKVFRRELERRAPSDRRELLEALTAATSWSTWDALRTHQQLSSAKAERTMKRIVFALLNER